jgi:hypothetical protein
VKAYVVGAGVSNTACYPLGGALFDAIDRFVRDSGPFFNGFDYERDWPELCVWMDSNSDPAIAQAYRTRQLEHMFTALDLPTMLQEASVAEIYRQMERPGGDPARAEEGYQALDKATREFAKHRHVLLLALEAYFERKHNLDANALTDGKWEDLRSFGNKLCRGDIVITFNYDATLEGVLHAQGKWYPQDGCGFELAFQRSGQDQTRINFPESPVTILHLHGAIGWYARPVFENVFSSLGAGAVSREALTAAPFETPIALDPIFLRDLGIDAVDASMPHRPPQDRQLLIHPSFLKDYESEGSGVFTELWRKAGNALRAADEVCVIGYSLPKADAAAMTLLLTNCERSKVTIVNPDAAANFRLRNLLSADYMGGPQWLRDWLRERQDCSEVQN